MIKMFDFIAMPLGWIIYLIYQYIGNYGLTLLAFTLLMKILMLPLAISQQKGMARMAAFTPKMKAIQTKYAKNKAKMNDEITKLYQEENYNPMSSCLPMLIQLPIMFGLMGVIYYPLTHILHVASDVAAEAATFGNGILSEAGIAFRDYTGEINALKAISLGSDAFAKFAEKFGEPFAQSLVNFDFSFMGIFLGDTPTLSQPSILWLIPVLSALFGAVTSWQAAKLNKATTGDSAAAGTSNSMLLMTPVMNAYISFMVPAGVGFYWLISSVLTVIQSFILNKIYNPAEMARKAQEKAEAEKELARQARIEAKKAKGQTITEQDLSGDIDDDDAGDEEKPKHDFTGMSQKEVNRVKLAEARKRDAERYGEEYVEVTDDDVR